ncbi:hypothetical protein BZA77DRAFT_362736 [Pyronema omphalodes]|nr:hypothetical protein BZA77DRAFT_362736 [Pyronema omphalodes]
MSTNNINHQPFNILMAMMPNGIAAHVVPVRTNHIWPTLPKRDGQLFEQEMTRAKVVWLVDSCHQTWRPENPTAKPAKSPDFQPPGHSSFTGIWQSATTVAKLGPEHPINIEGDKRWGFSSRHGIVSPGLNTSPECQGPAIL